MPLSDAVNNNSKTLNHLCSRACTFRQLRKSQGGLRLCLHSETIDKKYDLIGQNEILCQLLTYIYKNK